jgi:hypothetical protein
MRKTTINYSPSMSQQDKGKQSKNNPRVKEYYKLSKK